MLEEEERGSENKLGTELPKGSFSNEEKREVRMKLGEEGDSQERSDRRFRDIERNIHEHRYRKTKKALDNRCSTRETFRQLQYLNMSSLICRSETLGSMPGRRTHL